MFGRGRRDARNALYVFVVQLLNGTYWHLYHEQFDSVIANGSI